MSSCSARRCTLHSTGATPDAGATPRERIRGWYNLAGGGAGFLLIEADTPRELTGYRQPYMDLMSWDVRAICGADYEETIAQLRQVSQGTPSA